MWGIIEGRLKVAMLVEEQLTVVDGDTRWGDVGKGRRMVEGGEGGCRIGNCGGCGWWC